MALRIKNAFDLSSLPIAKVHKDKIKKALNDKPKTTPDIKAQPKDLETLNDPHQILFRAIENKYPGLAECEKTGLVENRKFRADIFIKSSGLVIEIDGFQFHRSKSAFQSDRDRRNLMVANGYPVLAYYYKRIKDDVTGVVAEIYRCHIKYLEKAKSHNADEYTK